ncbi:MAG: FAD-dependent thymidylate synthase [Thermoanaerobaculia bacterium]
MPKQQPEFPPVEQFSESEEDLLRPYVTNLDRPVFALVNLPEVVKGALFARYSRSSKSLRRLLLDEFMEDLPVSSCTKQMRHGGAETLYDRIFSEYGDDSVAQLGGVHLACEGVSNILTKVLERGRLMAYLEQSTRYVPYDDKPDGRWKYHTPSEIQGFLREKYRTTLDGIFDIYSSWIEPLQDYYSRRYPPKDGVFSGAYKRSIRAKALDALRGLLPAATRSNLGIYGTGQAYESLLLRMNASPLSEVRAFAGVILEELRAVIPSFMARVDRQDRGVLWSEYLRCTEGQTRLVAANLLEGLKPEPVPFVALTEFDPEGETKVVAAALYSCSDLPDHQLLSIARAMSVEERLQVLRAYVGNRQNRRHKPGRAFERTVYRFDILADYGAFRDLQRHRLLTLEWQKLSPDHGYVVAEAIEESGALDDWRRAMEASAELHQALVADGAGEVASYAVAMAYRVRFNMTMNARAAMHIIELRTAPQGHPAYRRVCQEMHRLIREEAGHRSLAAMMHFVDHGQVDLERLEGEVRAEARKTMTHAEPAHLARKSNGEEGMGLALPDCMGAA